MRRYAALALDPALSLALDLDRFEAAATSGLARGDPAALQRALALYAGPLLPGLPYEEWTLERRAALARLHGQVVLALAALGEPTAEERLRALLAEDPADERAGQALLRLLGGQGRRAEALRAYHALLLALQEELGVDPSAETAALHAALLEPLDAALLEPLAPQQHGVGGAASPDAPGTDAPRHNLPAALSSFVGRAWERAELGQLLARSRLLTVTGPGGCGKTRLALALATEQLATFPDGAWLVELAPAGAAVTPLVAHALGLREEPGRPLLETLTAHLVGRTALLVLDNCEHMVAGCATLAEAVLRTCPGLRILATSRERLGLTGEAVWVVPPLSLPPQGASATPNGTSATPEGARATPEGARATPEGASTLAQLAKAEAVQLFVERVRGVRPGFALCADNAPAVAQICRQLDGIPLALELAAARASVLNVEQIAARLGDRFRLLTGGSRAALPRQQTLRASMDWSYDLLIEAERALLRRLAVFAGGWRLEAAEAVCAGAGLAAAAVLDLLDGLVGKSLVQVEQGEGGSARYRLLETVRQYAGERLAAAGEGTAPRRRHLAWCVGLVEEAEPHLIGREQAAWLARLEDEHDNLRAALAWAASQQGSDVAAGVQLAGALWRFWYMRGHLSEGRAMLEALLALPGAGDVDAASRRRALTSAGILAHQQGDAAGATRHLEAALALARQAGDPHGICAVLTNLGALVRSLGEHGRAAALYEEALALARAGSAEYVPALAMNLGVIARDTGEYARAIALFEEGLALSLDRGNPLQVAMVRSNLAEVCWFAGQAERALALFQESLGEHQQLGFWQGVVMCLEGVAWAAHGAGDLLSSARLLGAAEALRGSLGFARDPVDQSWWTRGCAALRAAGGAGAAAHIEHAWAEGGLLSLEDAVATALAVQGLIPNAPGPWHP